ncbi:MAG: hypothetical protein CBC49_000640 [Alphaproteobacteria bacterium TMED89]|nr:MAG: hypothetical protein CBC49_000640 [Alphaproteobacteria bacterium TMED89]
MPKEFCIVTQQRSGSRFLSTMMASDPDVMPLGECFQNTNKNAESFLNYLVQNAAAQNAMAWGSFYRKAWQSYIAEQKQTRSGRQSALSFILMYNQLDFLPKIFLDFIFEKYHVVHLVRENLLRRHVSNFVNSQRLTPAHRKVQAELTTCTLPVDGIVKDLDASASAIAAVRNMLVDREVMEVRYEDLASREGSHHARLVADFVGIGQYPLTTDLKQTNPFPLRSMLNNFDEVSNVLRGTAYESLLFD